ncbi:hypothetical protein Taro_009271 [Colocasia esculenta]|uniref:Pentatricopeptide repeat-containing protein n=1 Tax=Colocasia esculenta TaxID=4460 RepID=A0A843U5Z5_COLES|nr:hypothetical protein [Colocasia esculenta]
MGEAHPVRVVANEHHPARRSPKTMRVPPPHVSRLAALLQRRCAPSAAAMVRRPSPSASSDGAQSAYLLRRLSSSSSSDSDISDSLAEIKDRILLLTEKPASQPRTAITDEVQSKLSALAEQLLALPHDEDFFAFLDSSSASSLFQETSDGLVCVELLKLLSSRPLLALEFLKWRRKRLVEAGAPMLAEEYVKGIMLAGRVKNIDLATELFNAAGAEGIRSTSTYNALMGAYMYTESAKKCLALFEELKQDAGCEPTIVTYNILLSVFGRSMLVDHMETILRAIKDSNLKPTLKTYNTVIAGYVTAWMWDKMEDAFQMMKVCGLEPDTTTHLLMLRGYAHKGDLEKMEKAYEIVKEWVENYEPALARVMICAYCRSSVPERVRKIENLSKLVPKDEYRPWLNVLLIRMYAQEGLMDKMEALITEAFSRGTVVTTVGIMNSIITSYFHLDAVDRLKSFIRQAESAGWRLCRSLYHCEMILYGKQSRFGEMKSVINEMEAYKFEPTKRTFWIMHKVYANVGKKVEADGVLGLMWKNGFINHEDTFHPS